MAELTPDVVAAMLERAGLTGVAFDAVEIATDLEERTAMNESLDELLEAHPRRDPVAFEAGWR